MTIQHPPTVPTLYHSQWYCSSMPYQILLELEVPSTSVAIHTFPDEESIKEDSSLLKLSPRGVLPVLALPTGEAILESGAIVLYFLEQFDQTGKLHPLPGTPDRPRFLQSVVFAVAEAYPAVIPLFMACRGVPKEERDRAVIDPLLEKYNKVVVQHLEHQLDFGEKDYYLGSEFTAADIMMGYTTMCATFIQDEDVLVKDTVSAYAKRIAERETYKKLYLPPSK